MKVTWSAYPGDVLGIGDEPVRLVGGVPWFVHARVAVDAVGRKLRRLYVAGPLEGPAAHVFGPRNDGCFEIHAVGDYGVIGQILQNDPEGRFLLETRAAASPFESVKASYTRDDISPSPFDEQQDLLLGATRAYFALYPAAVRPWTIATKTFETMIPSIEAPVLTGDTVVGIAGDPTGVAIAPIGSRYVISPEMGKSVSEVRLDRAGTEPVVVWAESETTDPVLQYVRPVMWSSPVATTLSGVVRTKIAVVDEKLGWGAARSVANRGFVAIPTSETTVLLLRRSDGLGWSIPTEPGTIVRGTLWVDDDEVWILTGRTGDPKDPNRSGILRIRRDSLGAPTVPRGF